MKMRQHKRWVMAKMWFNNAWQGLTWYTDSYFAGGVKIFDETPSPLGELLARKIGLQALVEDLPNLAPEFRCVKVNGGEVVDVFQTRSEALGLVLKHAKQRKAKLQVINTDTGEIELFTEEEMA